MGQVPSHNGGITVGVVGADRREEEGGGGEEIERGEHPSTPSSNYGHK